MFEAALSDVFAFDREDDGEPENPREKFDRMARERLMTRGPSRSSWWPND